MERGALGKPLACACPATQVETQFLLLELESSELSPADPEGGAAAGAAGNSAAAPPPPPAYALLLPLIDGGRFRATLRPPK